MINLIGFRCHSYQEFSEKLKGLNKDIEKGNVTKEGFCKISEFIENNKDLFIGNQRAALLLDSIGAKVCLTNSKDPLIHTLQKHVEQLLPTNREQIKVSLQFFRNTILNVTERQQSIADWISIMKIPLAHLDLSVEELASLLLRLEHIDLTDYNFESHDLKWLTEILIGSNFKFKTKDAKVLGIIARVCAMQNVFDIAYHIKDFEIEDPAVRLEIALFCATQSGYATASHIKNFDIADPVARGKIALACAKEEKKDTPLDMGSWAIPCCIKDFEIEDPVVRGEIALCCARLNGRKMAECIKNFEIEDPVVRGEIALCCARLNGRKTAECIKNFEIENPEVRAKIALICAEQEDSCIVGYIKNFEITNTAVLLEIVRRCADYGVPVAELIKNFEIADPAIRIEIACLCAQKTPRNTARFIKNFEIADQSSRIQIAAICAQHSGEGTAEYINNFEIVDAWIRVQIARLCAMKNGAMAEFIKNFEIGDEATRIEIAHLCAKQNVYATAEFIKNFEIADQAARAKIAHLIVKGHGRFGGWVMACLIKNFEIDDLALRVEIARLCAVNDGKGTSELIKNFEIAEEGIRGEIACLCAGENPSHTAENFKNFEILDSNLRSEIAFLCANNDAEDFPQFIKNFEIEDPKVRIEMARRCAKEHGAWATRNTARFIKNFEIDNPNERAEIARHCAEYNGGDTASYIKNFEIDDPSERAVIARLCAKNKGLATAQNFQNFEIEDLNVRFEIAGLCATQSAGQSAFYINNFDINDPLMRYEVACLCAKLNSKKTAECIRDFYLSNAHKEQMLLQCALLDPESLFLMGNFSPISDPLAKFPTLILILKSQDPALREELFNEIDQLIRKLGFPENSEHTLIKTSQEVRALPPHLQNVVGLWLLASIFMMSSIEKDAIEWMIRSGIWRELALLRDPGLRILLTQGLYELSADEDKRKSWEIFLSTVRGVEGQKGLMLLAIPFFALESEGIQGERLIEIALALAKCQKDKTSPLRSAYPIKNIVHTILALASTSAYNVEMKRAGLEKIFSIFDEKTIIKNIIAAKGLMQLKDQEWPTRVEDLSLLFSRSLEKVIPLENSIENVSEKYEEIFSSSRNPGGLLTYAAGLKTLGDPQVMACLSRYVVSVLKGTYNENRYTIERNPHLTKIMKSHGSLLKIWKEDLSFDLEALTSSDRAPIVFSPSEWLKIKLITDRHLGDTNLPFVSRYLAEDSNKEEVFQELVLQINVARKENKKKELKATLKELKGDNFSKKKQAEMKQELDKLNDEVSKDPVLARLNLEKACLNFIQKGQGNNKNVWIQLLVEINNALTNPNAAFSASEFVKDVKGLKEGFEEELKSQGKTKEGLKVLFTDNPIDLLLCGTDVSGSCQRLDGSPNLNKCLLGYLMDGKNRLIAIKEGNKMIARCILSLLWDGEKPVLYRERFYPDTTAGNYKTALNALAKKVATNLNVPLTSNDAGVLYGKKLEALGGPAPYEYSDGGGGVKKDGLYSILEAKQIV